MKLTLDHLVLGTADLARGAAQLTEWFGAAPFGGGEHELFATHNKLWRLEASGYPLYLELIAPNPAATLKRARWFGLDDFTFESDEVRYIGLVVRTDNIAQATQKLGADQYEVVSLARGALTWQFGLQVGPYRFPSTTPNLIEWTKGHPLDNVTSQGLTLTQVSWPHDLALDLDWPCSQQGNLPDNSGLQIRNSIGQTIQF